MKEDKLCKDCLHLEDAKPMARCQASKYRDLVTGAEKRECFIERLDGIGRCGTMGNNFKPRSDNESKVHPARRAKKDNQTEVGDAEAEQG